MMSEAQINYEINVIVYTEINFVIHVNVDYVINGRINLQKVIKIYAVILMENLGINVETNPRIVLFIKSRQFSFNLNEFVVLFLLNDSSFAQVWQYVF